VRPNLRIFLLDVHNEYGRCFGDRAVVMNPRNLKLPFWLFNFEEIVDVLFGGRPGVPEELEVLVEVIPMAKAIYTQYQNSDRVGLKRSTIYQRMSEGRFPKSRSLGPKCAVWVEAEIDDWIRRIASN